MKRTLSFCLGLALMQTMISMPARADDLQSTSSSSRQIVVEKKGYAFKYAQRLKDWNSEIETGTSKGWLTPDEAQKFKDRLVQMRSLNDTVSSHGYPQSELNDMEKQFNQFNIDLSHATEKANPPAATSSKPQESTKPVSTAAETCNKNQCKKPSARANASDK